MRQSDVYKINVPELGDRSDITVVSDAILAGEKNTIGNVQWMKATNSGNIITLTSETRTAKMSKYYNGLAVQFVSPISITSASGAQIKVDNLEAQPFTTTNDIEIGNVVCAVYSTSGFTANKMGVAVIDNLTTADSKKALSANQGKVLNEKKADKTIQVIAGNGLTGGGDLNANRTLNVASANDGITVNANNIQLNTVDNLTTTSTTKPLSANQGKILSEKVDNAVSTVVNKLDRGSLPENIANAKDLYSLLENNGGLTFDTNCTYIQESKQKNVGYVYFDRNTKGLFECYKTAPASVVINDAQYFRDISNKANSDRLTNLDGRLANLIRIKQVIYGGFGSYKNIEYPEGFNISNCSVMIIDVDEHNRGTCVYSLSENKLQFKGQRLNGDRQDANTPIFFFIKK